MAADCLLEHLPVGLNVVALVVDGAGTRCIKVPVLLNRKFVVVIQFEPVPRHELKYSVVKSFFAGEIAEGKVLRQAGEIKLGANVSIGQNDFDLGTEEE